MPHPATASRSDTAAKAGVPRVVLKPRRALPFFNRHPWVFAGAIKDLEGEPAAGDVVDLHTDRGEFVARGLFNPDSNIRVRLYAWDAETDLDRDFFRERIDDAVRLRERLFPDAGPETAYRAIFSEADGLSGLTVDRYGDFLAVQLTSRALGDRRELLFELLRERLNPKGIRLRTEKGIREAEGLEIADDRVWGDDPPRPLFVEENGVRFGVDLVEGQKTGYYLDQRDNRAAVARHAQGHRVLDLFCYTGGFGITALVRGGAKQVVGIDVSATALDVARANAELNGVANRVAYQKADGFDAIESLAAEGERFDTVVLDPPKMTRHRKGVEKALKGYLRLNLAAVSVLERDGILATCTCSGHVHRDDFVSMLSQVAQQSGRRIQVLEARRAAPDHPVSVSCPETDYLQCYVCRVT